MVPTRHEVHGLLSLRRLRIYPIANRMTDLPVKEMPKVVKRLRSELMLSAAELKIGMFVSTLDCGWRNTPFLLEGLLISSQEDIDTIRRLAIEVTVDPTRSELAAFDARYRDALYEEVVQPEKRKARAPVLSSSVAGSNGKVTTGKWWRRLFHRHNSLEIKPQSKRGNGRTYPRHEPRTVADTFAHTALAIETDTSFKDYIAGIYRIDIAPSYPNWLDRFQRWVLALKIGTATRKGVIRSRRASQSRPDYVPSDVDLVIYPDPEPTSASVPQAKAACRSIEKSLRRIVTEIAYKGVSNAESLKEAADTLAENVVLRPDTMMWVAKMRDASSERYQQALSVAVHLTALGRQLGFPKEPLADLASIGLLLDLGKLAMEPALLGKPGPLNEREAEKMRAHVELGLDMFADSPKVSALVKQAVAEHHERVDGTGYPNQLPGDQISIYGKMAAIADSYVAMTNPRSYAPTHSPYEAIRELFQHSNSQWHGPLVEQFVQAIGIFPVGSMVELSTGEVALVVQHNALRRLEPRVLILTNMDKGMLKQPWEIDILQYNMRAKSSPVRIIKGLTDGAYGINFRDYYVKNK